MGTIYSDRTATKHLPLLQPSTAKPNLILRQCSALQDREIPTISLVMTSRVIYPYSPTATFGSREDSAWFSAPTSQVPFCAGTPQMSDYEGCLLGCNLCTPLLVQNHVLKDSQLVFQTTPLTASICYKLGKAQLGSGFHLSLSNAGLGAGHVLKDSLPSTMKLILLR